MLQEEDPRKWSWRYITTSQVLTTLPCEFTCLNICPSAAACQVEIYNGENASAPLVLPVYLAVQLNYEYSPKKAIFCNQGLFVALTANVTGVLIQWREYHPSHYKGLATLEAHG